MNKPTRFLPLLAFLAIAGTAGAQDKMELRVVANDSTASAIGETAVFLDSKLKFSESGVDVFQEETLKATFNYADVSNLKFRLVNLTGVKGIEADAALRLRNNPVDDSLEVLGFSGNPVKLTVTDLRGAVRVSIPEWAGEAADVSELTPGLYFVTVNQTTLKFIKK